MYRIWDTELLPLPEIKLAAMYDSILWYNTFHSIILPLIDRSLININFIL